MNKDLQYGGPEMHNYRLARGEFGHLKVPQGPADRDNPQHRAAALKMLRMLDESKLTIDDILAAALIVGDELSVCVRGIPIRVKVD